MQTTSPANKPDCPHHNIVLVDDEPAFRSVLKEILTTFGFSVYAYGLVAPALENLEKDLPDLILTDIMMPDIDGYQFIQAVQENQRFKNVPVIVISALAQPEDRNLSVEYGAAAYLTKPFTARELRQVITDLLGF